MAWIYLLIAGVLEIGWVICLRLSEGFTRVIPMIGYAVFGLLAAFFLSKALKTMHVGTAYAIWMGIAVTGTTLTSVLVYKEPTSWIRVAFVGLIVFGIVGLQLTSPQKP